MIFIDGCSFNKGDAVSGKAIFLLEIKIIVATLIQYSTWFTDITDKVIYFCTVMSYFVNFH